MRTPFVLSKVVFVLSCILFRNMQAKKEEWKMNHSVKRGPKTLYCKNNFHDFSYIHGIVCISSSNSGAIKFI